MRPTASPPGRGEHQAYVEVWNDTVDLRHLSASLLIGVTTGLPLFLISRAVLRGWLNLRPLADGCALLMGLTGCLAAGAVCARLFPPKRLFADENATASTAMRRAALAELTRDSDTTTPAQLPAGVRGELQELGLMDDQEDSGTDTGTKKGVDHDDH
ncbi:hypothetical protein ACFYOV_30030 [Streptomyces sp. NPDC005931]|uniref:hypothetical protein n=1 Tax=Streptomyces sp. NPDC005931 TaxID=3364737 RepID=UPI0036AE1EB6